jgi:hypothetical protein
MSSYAYSLTCNGFRCLAYGHTSSEHALGSRTRLSDSLETVLGVWHALRLETRLDSRTAVLCSKVCSTLADRLKLIQSMLQKSAVCLPNGLSPLPCLSVRLEPS